LVQKSGSEFLGSKRLVTLNSGVYSSTLSGRHIESSADQCPLVMRNAETIFVSNTPNELELAL
jgi:hypothetical protein